MRANETVRAGDLAPGAFEGLDKAARTINGRAVGPNLALNPLFRWNARGAGSSVSAGAGWLDGWKGGASGASVSLLSSETYNITAGSLITVIDGAALGGVFTVSHEGTAPLRLDAGQWFAGAHTVETVRGTSISIELGVGTVSRLQVTPGRLVMPFATPDPALERARLDYYVRKVLVLRDLIIGGETWDSAFGTTLVSKAVPIGAMRASPSVSFLNNADVQVYSYAGSWAASTLSASMYGAADALELRLSATAAGDGRGMLVRRNASGDVYAILSAEL